MHKKKKKVVANSGSVVPRKFVPDPRATLSDLKERKVVWRFSQMDRGWTHCLELAAPEDLVDLIAKLASFDSMKYGELVRHGSDHCKSYEITQIEKFAQQRLEIIKRDDLTEIHRLRFSGKKRLYGFFEQEVFNILWWDPDHEIFPSRKRNT